MKYLSVCSGIEAATVAWHPLGFSPVAFSEIDKFPCAVLAHHYPAVPNYGDMTRFKDWPDANVDLLVGGTPCQSFSVAGLRKGLDDPRGSLLLVYLAIARRYRPRWLVWENVPGVLSSDDGRAFGSLLGGLAELGYRFAYRVLDAQYFGLAQRRQRVFVVGHLGDWRRAAAVLFERESLSGHPAPSREPGQEPAPCLGAGPVSGGRTYGTDADSVKSLVAIQGAGTRSLGPHMNGCGISDDGAMYTLQASEQHAVAFAWQQAGDTALGMTGEGVPPLRKEQTLAMLQGMQVRRLTPRECERLQGFPDDYTLIHYNGKLAKDGPRYKALGNSMAVPCMAWIGRRVQLVDGISSDLEATA